MSTRASIVIRQHWFDRKNNTVRTEKVFLYHHSDGYPSFLGQILSEYIKKNYPDGKTYPDVEIIATELVKQGIPYKNYKGEQAVDNSFQCAYCMHGDIEYMYLIEVPGFQLVQDEDGVWEWHYTEIKTTVTCRKRYIGDYISDDPTDEELEKFPLVFTTEDDDFELTDEYFEKQDSKF